MYCKRSSKTGPLSGVDPRETSWRTYSKSLIVELKEKLADRRARTLALLSENGDLATFNEIDTESDGLDDTSSNMINMQGARPKEDTVTQEQSGERNSLSETSSLTESDYNDVIVKDEESRRSPEISNSRNARCCSNSCSTITSISGGSYTSEDVSSRSLDDFVADVNLGESAKGENCPCPHGLGEKCSICLVENYARNDSECGQSYQSIPQDYQDINRAYRLSQSSVHCKRITVTQTSPHYDTAENDADLLQVKSDTSLYVAVQSEAAYLHSHSATAGLLIVSTVTEVKTSFNCQVKSESLISVGSDSYRVVREQDSSQGESRGADENMERSNSPGMSAQMCAGSPERDHELSSNHVYNYLEMGELEEDEFVTDDKEKESVKEEHEEDKEQKEVFVKEKQLKIEDKVEEIEVEEEKQIELEIEEQVAENQEIREEREVIEEENVGRESGREEQSDGRESGREEQSDGRELGEQKNRVARLGIVETVGTEEKQAIRGQKGDYTGKEEKTETTIKEYAQQIDTSCNGDIEQANQTEDGIEGKCEDGMDVQGKERLLDEGNFESNHSEISSHNDKLEDPVFPSLDTNEVDHNSLSLLKNLYNELVQIFEDNSEFYNDVDKSIVNMFENHSVDFNMLVSAYKNKSSNSGYIQTRKQTSESTALQTSVESSTREDTATKVDDQNRSLQACLEKARLASTLQGELCHTRNRTDKSHAIRAYEQTMAELEKSMMNYLQVYALEAIADGTHCLSEILESSDGSTEKQLETMQQNRHNVLRRSDTFVVKNTCTGRPPNNAKRRKSCTSLIKGHLAANTRNMVRRIDEEAGDIKNEESPNAPHSSPTFLVTNESWNISSELTEMAASSQSIQDKADHLGAENGADHGFIKRHRFTASTSCKFDGEDFDSDSSESLSEVKETENLTYTSSLLAQLLDYNSADEFKTLKEGAQPEHGQDKRKKTFLYKKIKSPEALEEHHSNVQNYRVRNAKDSHRLQNDPSCGNTAVTSPDVKLFSLQKNDRDESLEKYNDEFDFNHDNYDEDAELDAEFMLSVCGLEMSTGGSHQETVNIKNKSKRSHNCARGSTLQGVKHASNVNLSILTHDASKSDERTVSSHDPGMKKPCSLSSPKVNRDSSPSQEIENFSKINRSVVHTRTGQLDTSPVAKTRPEEVVGHNVCSQITGKNATYNEASGSCFRHYLLEQDDHQSHKKWKLSKDVRDEIFEEVDQEASTPKADWSSSDDDALGDLQRDVSPSDLLRQKQKRDVDVKLQQLDQYSRRTRKSRCPLRHRTSPSIPSWIDTSESPHKVNIITEVSAYIANTQERTSADLNFFQESQRALQHLHQYTSLTGQFDIDTLTDTGYNTRESGDTPVFMTPSQLLHARSQEDTNGPGINEFSEKLNEKTNNTDQNKSHTGNDYERLKTCKETSGEHSTDSLNTYEEKYLDTTSHGMFPIRSASTSSRKDKHALLESGGTIASKYKDDLNVTRSEAFNTSIPFPGKISDEVEDTSLKIKREALFENISVGTAATWRGVRTESDSKEHKGVATKVVLNLTNTSVSTHIDQSDTCFRDVDFGLQDVEPNCVGNLDEVNLDLARNGDYPHDSTHQSLTVSTHFANSKWKNSPNANGPWCDTHTSNRILSSSEVDDEYGKRDNVVTRRVLCDHSGVSSNEHDESLSATNFGKTRDTDLDISREQTLFNDTSNFDNYISEKKRTFKRVNNEPVKQILCSSLPGKTSHQHVQSNSIKNSCVQLGQKKAEDPMRSAFQEASQDCTLSQPCMSNSSYLLNEDSHDVSIEPGYQELEVLRHKIRRLEQMLGNIDVTDGNIHESNTSFGKKETPTFAGPPPTCPCCQHGVLGTSLVHRRCPQSGYQAHHRDRRCYEQSRDLSLSPSCESGHVSSLHLQAGAYCHDKSGANHQVNVTSKDCQTSDDRALTNLKSKAEVYVDDWTQFDASFDVNICKSVEGRLAKILYDMKQTEEGTKKLMVELDQRINMFANTSTTLADESKRLEHSQIFMSERFQNMEDNLRVQRDISNSMREFMNAAEKQSEIILESLKSQQDDVIARSVQTVEEAMCPLLESLLIQKNEIGALRSCVESVVSCLEDRRSEKLNKGMSNDTMKGRIVELTSQRDSEKVFHRITRQALRALERDHDRLRQEYIRATYRRNNHSESDVHNRIRYFVNSPDECHHCNNNSIDVRETQTTGENCSSACSAESEEDTHTQSGNAHCGKHRSHHHQHRSNTNCHRLSQCSCTFAMNRTDCELPTRDHERTRTSQQRGISKQNNTKQIHTVPPESNREIRERISFSDHSREVVPVNEVCQEKDNSVFCGEDLVHTLLPRELTASQTT